MGYLDYYTRKESQGNEVDHNPIHKVVQLVAKV